MKMTRTQSKQRTKRQRTAMKDREQRSFLLRAIWTTCLTKTASKTLKMRAKSRTIQRSVPLWLQEMLSPTRLAHHVTCSQEEATTAMEQLRSVPLGTLAKASQALDSGKKRKRSDAKSSAQNDATKAQAKAALDELRSHRKGRTAPRFQQGTSAEGADLSGKSEQKAGPERKKWKEVEHRANKHACVHSLLSLSVLPADSS